MSDRLRHALAVAVAVALVAAYALAPAGAKPWLLAGAATGWAVSRLDRLLAPGPGRRRA